MGDGTDECLDREMNEWMEETRPIYEGDTVCPMCGLHINSCCCNERPNEV